MSSLNVRTHKDHYKPEIYGTITGESLKSASTAALKDGGMDWGSKKDEKKEDKKGAKAVEPKKEESRKAEPKKAESKTEEPKKEEPKKGEVKKSASKVCNWQLPRKDE